MTQTARDSIRSIGVVGGGAWGTALASTCTRSGLPVTLWAYEQEVVEAMNNAHENPVYLPGIALPDTLKATAELADMSSCDAVLMVTPAQHLGSILSTLTPHLKPGASVVLCAKGIEQNSLRFMSEVAGEHIDPSRLAVLSGPSFAADVARGLPTAVTLACTDQTRGKALSAAIGQVDFRTYLSDDVIGAEIGGVVKNVLAIACGIVAGRELGESARAALTARGYAEMTRLGVKLGAKAETLGGLSGLGDLILTCASPTSRNFSLGVALGQNRSADDVLASRSSVSEGALSAAALAALADKLEVDMPICQAVAQILDGSINVNMAISQLLARPFKREA